MNYQVISLKQQTSITSQFLQVWNLGEDSTGQLAQDLSGGCSQDVGQGCCHLKARLGLEAPPSKSLIHGLLVEASVPRLWWHLPLTPLDRQVELFSYLPEQAVQERARKKLRCLFTAYSQKWRSITLPYPVSHTGLVQSMCVPGGTVQGHEYQRRRSTGGQPGGWLPQTLLVTASKNIRHVWINLTTYMLNLHAENDKMLKKLRPKWRKYIQRLQIARYTDTILLRCLILSNVLGFNVISGFLNRDWWTDNKICM